MNRRDHWSQIYETTQPTQVGWFQAQPEQSLQLIRRFVPDPDAAIIDVGGGASTLVDHLLRLGYRNLTVLDIAGVALHVAQTRLGPLGPRVRWLEADILTMRFPSASYDLWHDRAVFHFLLAPDEQTRYVAQVAAAVRPGAVVVLATFALDGPDHCSGLPVQRYTPESLAHVLGTGFDLIDAVTDTHTTPKGACQAYLFSVFRRSLRST